MSQPEEIERWIAAAADGTLTAEAAAELLEVCHQQPAVLRQSRDHVAMERLLGLHGAQQGLPEGFSQEVLARIVDAAPAGPQFTPQVMRRLPPAASKRILRFPRWQTFAAAAAVALFAGLTWHLLQTPASSRPVARLVASEAAPELQKNASFFAGQRLRLASGIARLEFRRGADLILEGPAELEFTHENAAILLRGSASVRVPARATGFTLAGPDARVIDVGTRFAMKVSPEGPTEVHVLEGLVLASTSANPEKRELRQAQSIAVISGKAETIRYQPEHFVTALPQRQAGPPGYLHWSFDESQGLESPNSGPGLLGSTSSAFLRSLQPGAPGPQRVPGVFGSGIFLDGAEAFLETDFPGIGGGNARTVALWMKLPADWTPLNGYALASWGSLKAPGNAWQMSVNPGDFGGAIGHLRVGVHGSYAVGATDLRDGRWHHVAAVMYEADQASIATHVLLYVDGELEPAEVKSTRRIDTDVSRARSVRLQLGRNLSSAIGFSPKKAFFRGWLDEVYVVGEALTQAQVQGLMRENRLR